MNDPVVIVDAVLDVDAEVSLRIGARVLWSKSLVAARMDFDADERREYGAEMWAPDLGGEG